MSNLVPQACGAVVAEGAIKSERWVVEAELISSQTRKQQRRMCPMYSSKLEEQSGVSSGGVGGAKLAWAALCSSRACYLSGGYQPGDTEDLEVAPRPQPPPPQPPTLLTPAQCRRLSVHGDLFLEQCNFPFCQGVCNTTRATFSGKVKIRILI